MISLAVTADRVMGSTSGQARWQLEQKQAGVLRRAPTTDQTSDADVFSFLILDF